MAAGGPPGAPATTPCSSFLLLPLQLSKKIFRKNVAIKKARGWSGKSCLPAGGGAVCVQSILGFIFAKRRWDIFCTESIPGFIVANEKVG